MKLMWIGLLSLLLMKNTQAAAASGKPIIWAGIQANEPRYIQKGPLKGYGYIELHTQDPRKAARAAGFQFDYQYVTTSRLAKQFRDPEPLCFYPYEWQNPKDFFAKRPDRILSFPIGYVEAGGSRIVLRKNNLEKLKKHLDAKGDVKIDDLLADSTLKTALINGRDYGALGNKLLGFDGRDFFVNEAFKRSVSLVVASENKQILQMLNGDRVDYVLSRGIENTDFERAGIDRTQFVELNYATTRITGMEDPNLTFRSIACNVTPETIKLLPHFNKTIRDVSRGFSRYMQLANYETMLSGQSQGTWDQTLTVLLSDGLGDWWYGLQQKHFPDLRDFPEEMPEAPLPASATKPAYWYLAKADADTLVLLHESDAGALSPYYAQARENSLWVSTSIDRHTNLDRFAPIGSFTALMKQPILAKAEKLENMALLATDKAAWTKLVIYGRTIHSSALAVLRPLLSRPGLQELSLLQADPELTRDLLKVMPTQIKRLNLAGSSLIASDFAAKVREMPLTDLTLAATQLRRTQLNQIFQNLPPTLVHLDMAEQSTAWSQEVWGQNPLKLLPNLKTLILNSNGLTDADMPKLAKMLPAGLNILNLAGTRITDKGVATILQRLSQLEELDISEISGLSNVMPLLVFPDSLKRLSMYDANLSGKNWPKIKFPPHLETLNLGSNAIDDEQWLSLAKNLAPQMQLLNVGLTGISSNGIAGLFSAGVVKTIESFSAINNFWEDAALVALAQTGVKIGMLNLNGNRLTNASAEVIAKHWMPELKSLAISRNLITNEGVEALVKEARPGLRLLAAQGILSLDLASIAGNLPSTLEALDVESNGVADQDLAALQAKIPADLLFVSLVNSPVSARGLAAFLAQTSSRFSAVSLTDMSWERDDTQAWLQAPASLNVTTLGRMRVNSENSAALQARFPRRVETVNAMIDFDASVTAKQKAEWKALLSDATNVSTDSEELMQSVKYRNIRSLWQVGKACTSAFTPRADWVAPPATIERYMVSTKCGGIIQALAEHPYEQLELLGLVWDGMTLDDITALNRHKRHVHSFWLGSYAFSDVYAEALTENFLGELEYAEISRAPKLTERGIIAMFKQMKGIRNLRLISTGLGAGGVDQLIKYMPATLRMLHIAGSDIGEGGVGKLRQWAGRRSAELGLPVVFED